MRHDQVDSREHLGLGHEALDPHVGRSWAEVGRVQPTTDRHEDLDVESLARRSLMSPRTFARRFRAETGATPHSWVTRQRVQRAEELDVGDVVSIRLTVDT